MSHDCCSCGQPTDNPILDYTMDTRVNRDGVCDACWNPPRPRTRYLPRYLPRHDGGVKVISVREDLLWTVKGSFETYDEALPRAAEMKIERDAAEKIQRRDAAIARNRKLKKFVVCTEGGDYDSPDSIDLSAARSKRNFGC